MDSRKTSIIILISLVAVIGFSITTSSVAAYISEYGDSGTLRPGTQFYDTLTVGEGIKPPVNNQPFTVQTNGTLELYLLNATAFAQYLSNESNSSIPSTPILPKTAWLPVSVNGLFSQEWNVTYLNETYGLPIINNTGGRSVWMMVLLANPINATSSVKFMVRLNYTQFAQFVNDLTAFTRFLDISCFGIVSIKLLWATRRLTKAEETKNRAEIVRGMGLAYLCVFTAYSIGWLQSYLDENYGPFALNPLQINFNLPHVPSNSYNLFTMLLYMLASLTFLALTYSVQKRLKNAKHPIVAYMQLVAACLFPIVFLLPLLYLVAIIYLIVALVAAAVLVITVYVQLAIKFTGIIRYRSIATLIGMVLPLGCFAIREFAPNMIGNWFFIILDMVTVCGLLFFWWGNMKYLERPVEVAPAAAVQA
jgi:hypothetical protein